MPTTDYITNGIGDMDSQPPSPEGLTAVDEPLFDTGESDVAGLIEWVNRRENWEKYIWQSRLTEGRVDVDVAYRFFKERYQIDPTLIEVDEITVANLLPPEDEPEEAISLIALSECQNVNALDGTYTLPLGSPLTVIFGKNGVGKSGYSRLLANSCYCRGDREIIPNIYGSDAGEVSAKFQVKYGDKTRELTYTSRTPIQDLKRFYIFDNRSVPLQLNDSSTISFVPAQLKLIDQVREYIEYIERKLDNEIREKRKDNPALNAFGNEQSLVRDFFFNLNYQNTIEQIDGILFSSDNEEETLKQLEEQLAKNTSQKVPERKKEITSNRGAVLALIQSIEGYVEYSKPEKWQFVITAINELLASQEVLKTAGVEQFNDGLLKTIGSDKWRSLLVAARELYDHERENGNETINNCVLCKQSLDTKEIALFESYWAFLASKAEEENKKNIVKIEKLKQKISQLIVLAPKIDESHAVHKFLIASKPEVVQLCQHVIASCAAALQICLQAIESMNPEFSIEEVIFDKSGLDELVGTCNKEIESLKDPSKENAGLLAQITEIKHKQRMRPLRTALAEYLAYMQWKRKADTAPMPVVKAAYTRKRTDLFNQIVSEKYKDTLNQELDALGARVNLKLVSSGSHGQTLLKLQLADRCAHKATDILSEGEQKSCALADFLTEVQLDNANCGIIFDDPVTSLDHERKERIAERLAMESTNRQVIIFTHDIVFLLLLEKYSKKHSLPISVVSIRRANDIIGIVDPDLPWIAQNVSKRKGFLKNKFHAIAAMVSRGDSEDEIIFHIKGWYVFLREGWEKSVEERLFNYVVQRYDLSVQTQRLKKVVVNDELIGEIEAGMIESNSWVHDKSESEISHVIDINLMEQHLARFENFIDNMCAANK